MKNYRYYAEMPEDRGSKSGSRGYDPFTREWLRDLADDYRGHNNCIAVPLENGHRMFQGSTLRFDIYSAVNDRSNSPVEGSSTDGEYLRKRCVRIDAELARRLHPALFDYLERP